MKNLTINYCKDYLKKFIDYVEKNFKNRKQTEQSVNIFTFNDNCKLIYRINENEWYINFYYFNVNYSFSIDNNSFYFQIKNNGFELPIIIRDFNKSKSNQLNTNIGDMKTLGRYINFIVIKINFSLIEIKKF